MHPSHLFKAFLLNNLAQRTLLYKMHKFYARINCEQIFGKDVSNTDFADDRLGDHLEDLANANLDELYGEVVFRALLNHEIKVEVAHVDSTNFSVQGEYDDPDNDFIIACGAPKRKRTDLKAHTLGLAVQQDGVPPFVKPLPGNTSDAVWFREALNELMDVYKGDHYTRPVFVFDAAVSNTEMFNLTSDQALCLIRLSETFVLAHSAIERAWKTGFVKLCQIATSAKKNTSECSIATFFDFK